MRWLLFFVFLKPVYAVVAFDYGFAQIVACTGTGTSVEVTWTGNHNIQETSGPGCSSGNLGLVTNYETVQNYGTVTFSGDELTAAPGTTRYFKCDSHCGTSSARFEVSCPASCPAGQYLDTGVCESCPNGYSQEGTGTFANSFGTTHSETDCDICPVGYVTYNGTDGNYPSHSHCHQCRYQIATTGYHYMDESGYTGTECMLCPHGSTVTTPGHDCLTECWAGRYSASGYWTDGDPDSCTVCPRGYVSEENGNHHTFPYPGGTVYNVGGNTECTICPIGWQDYTLGGNSNEFRICTACRPEFSHYGNATGQLDCYDCYPGSVHVEPGTNNGLECYYCEPGKYYTGDPDYEWYTINDPEHCADCDQGSLSTTYHSTTCVDCQAGSGLYDVHTCTDCSTLGNGNDYIGDGTSPCQQCPTGEITLDGVTCACPQGYLGVNCATNACEPTDTCPKGQYDDGLGGCLVSPQFADKAAWLAQIQTCNYLGTNTDCVAANGYPDFGRYDTSLVQDMNVGYPLLGTTFSPAGPVDWDTSSVTTMETLFRNGYVFDACLWEWDTSKVTNMHRMFRGARVFNKPLIFDTSSVENFHEMFYQAKLFNQDLNWDTSSAEDMGQMFFDAEDFNGDVSGWDTSSVTEFEHMFRDADAFNVDISNWDTSLVQDFYQMFYSANVFDQDLSGWDISSATRIGTMFQGSSQSGTWCMETGADYSSACSNAPCTIYCPPTPCSLVPCENGALCSDTGAGGTYTCDCTGTGFEGVNCTDNIDDCPGHLCENEATCVDGVNAYTCDCSTAPGWTGATCSDSIDDCPGHGCLNGGTCFDGNQSYTCDCSTAPGWTGTICADSIDDCGGNDCVNGGVCVDGHNGYSCACTGGYEGIYCESGPCNLHPCVGANCTNLVNDYSCDCKSSTLPMDKNCVPLPPLRLRSVPAESTTYFYIGAGILVMGLAWWGTTYNTPMDKLTRFNTGPKKNAINKVSDNGCNWCWKCLGGGFKRDKKRYTLTQ